jgi:hypothetical protein
MVVVLLEEAQFTVELVELALIVMDVPAFNLQVEEELQTGMVTALGQVLQEESESIGADNVPIC